MKKASWWDRFRRPEPITIVLGTPVIATTKSGARIRGIVKSIRTNHTEVGVLMAGAADTPNNLLWFKGEDLKLDTEMWKG
jgi:hypothetical protein